MTLFPAMVALATLGIGFAKAARPNMVIVLVDDHAFEAISAYGTYLRNHARTPAIDRLWKEADRASCVIASVGRAGRWMRARREQSALFAAGAASDCQ